MQKSVLCLLILILWSSTLSAEDAYRYEGQGKRDPFVPLVGVTSKSIESLDDIMSIEDVDLQGIASDSRGKKAAIINGEMIREGEGAARLKIIKITKDSVVLTIEDEEYTINIHEETAQ